MAQTEYTVEGRSFRTASDYRLALRDKETIDRLRTASSGYDIKKLEQLLEAVQSGKCNFQTLLGQDFEDELIERIKRLERQGSAGKTRDNKRDGKRVAGKSGPQRDGKRVAGKSSPQRDGKRSNTAPQPRVEVSDKAVQLELKRREKRRRLVIALCAAVAVASLGYFGVYNYYNYRTENNYSQLNALKEKKPNAQNAPSAPPVIHYTTDEPEEIPEVLDEYKNLLNKNKKLIGWVKIDDTNIDYPVMQTSDNEYYLDHNLNQEYDRNGSIFMDKDCNVIRPSTNLILYGHHMKSGRMFGGLNKYEEQDYRDRHRYINFDTIYEKGIYEVMYVFRARVYSEEEVVFKYYQFIDAMSELEFNSNMKEMAAMSLYDTGVTAEYGDRLLTLSTCDYQEKDGRFVVVAKKVAAKE